MPPLDKTPSDHSDWRWELVKAITEQTTETRNLKEEMGRLRDELSHVREGHNGLSERLTVVEGKSRGWGIVITIMTTLSAIIIAIAARVIAAKNP